MTDDSGQPPWFPPAMMKKQLEEIQEAGENVAESQQELWQQFMQTQSPFDELSTLGPTSLGTATFKARVQSGGRISIPEPEREALDIEEGDIVQTIVVPVKRDRDQE
ncbi:AbrB/MazE/SpoVT family DNA-binding domain-containing protein [Natrialbaceae archaeon AArc-T1-2]|uniref:AbrB/MazE/SpoVT family DNA-binding domain-containing protein n=1 Tax=Natrialbaceae archaeon AArc-T1-2 TaxID=3053904 RepID=UPI00255ACD0C|nr:AbrB/MazE/SpoVT family DNA-binding domain-containing protein [Natrialbaceae archaeon AArc-T1-2]WIV68257.1 AbrB/MazE/SpoVT family DNA-binding domain-containing protein [Natrialbaceae archaeon AArc-T1-2]